MDATHFTGASSEALVAHKLLRKGIEVFLPVATQSSSDMIGLHKGELMKVQVKTASKIVSSNLTYLQARLRSKNSKVNYLNDYGKDLFTHLALVYNEDVWLVPWELVYGNKSITLGRIIDGQLQPKRQGKCMINWEEYKL